MKIAIIGYGKMGQAVEKAAIARGHEIVSIIDLNNSGDFNSEAFRSADVAIEFSTPDAGWDNIKKSWSEGVPVVCGTTGWLTPAMETEVHEWCSSKQGTLLTAPNFSLGVNITMIASKLLARLLAPHDNYSVRIHEVHHIHKKDHPSGTAILLANGIIEDNNRYNVWLEESSSGSLPSNAIPISHSREDEVPGIHDVIWDSPCDTITLKHEAKNRDGFATGAVVAAEWLSTAPKGKHYTMTDVLKNLI